MYHRGMKWEKYLELRGFKDDIVHGLERQTGEIVIGQARAAGEATAAGHEVARATSSSLSRGFGSLIASQQEMATVVETGFGAISYELECVAGGIDALRADFNWAMGAVIWKLEMQQETLQNILETLQAPLDIQAKELRSRAEDAYRNGWYEEALGDFLESESKNYQDFAVHQAIGNIYLYHGQPADLEKAREYYLKAAKYATPRSEYHAALGYMHAGLVCYVQRDDCAAIEYGGRATELYPDLAEAFYNHAKFAAAAGRADIAVPSLETAIRADRDYAVKARADADFESVECSLGSMMERLLREARQKAEAQRQALKEDVGRRKIGPENRRRLEAALAEVESRMERNTYFGYLDAPAKIQECREILKGLRLPQRDRVQGEATELLSELRTEMADYVMPDAFRAQLESDIEEAEGLLEGVPTYYKACAAKEKAAACAQSLEISTGWAVMHRHEECVYDVAFSSDGVTLASAIGKHHGHQNRAFLWNSRTGLLKQLLLGHTKPVFALDFSPDGKTIASASADNTVRLWDVNTGEERAILEGHTHNVYSVDFSPDGTTVASASLDKTVRLWDAHTGRERAVLRGHNHYVNAIAFSPDGMMLASGSDDETVRLWDVRTRRERKVLRRHDGEVNAVAFSLDGAMLASGSDDKTVRLWDANTGQERAVLRKHTNKVNAVAFSPDRVTLASGGGEYEGGDYTVRLWYVATGRERAVLKGHTSIVNAVAFSPCGTVLASGSWDKTVRLWGVLMSQRDWEQLEKGRRWVRDWQRQGRCEMCGAKLGPVERLLGNTRCSRHR